MEAALLFLQQADGRLAKPVKYPTAPGSGLDSVAVGDVNADGRQDVVIAGVSNGLAVFIQNAAGALDPFVLYATPDNLRVKIADLTGDGRQDVVAIGWGTGTASVFVQQESGALAAPAVYSVPHAGYDDLEVGDLNHDGRTDVLVMSGQLYGVPNFSVLYQQPGGTLGGLVSRTIGTNQLAGGIGLGDVNSDGRRDVAVAMNWAGGGSPFIALFHQGADGTLPAVPSTTMPTSTYPEPLEVADLDLDGRDDVLVMDGSVDLGVYLQASPGVLAAERTYPVPYATHYNRHALAVGDLDGDGQPDVAIANYNSGLVVVPHFPPLSLPCPVP